MLDQARGDPDHGRGRDPDVNDVLDGIPAEDERDEGEDLSDDDVFEVLYNRRRRDVIAYLRDRDGTATVSDLAEHIAAEENDTTVRQLSSYERKRVYVGLYQNHLPLMDDVGVVDYDKNRGTVELRESAAQLEPYLDDAGRSGGHLATVAGAFTLATVLLLGILDVGLFAAVPNVLWITVGVTGFFGLAVVDAYDLYPK